MYEFENGCLVVIEKLGSLHYKVCLDDGRIWKRYASQVRKIGENTLLSETSIKKKDHEFEY